MLLDDYLPRYDVTERHQIVIDAPLETVYAAVRQLDLRGSGVIRWLFRLRGLPALFQPTGEHREGLGLTLDGLLRSGFVLLGEARPHELLLGLVGQFWTAGGGLRRVGAAQFKDFDTVGYAKAAWDFSLEQADGMTRLSTETRVQCLDPASRRKFRAYWALIGPFSGLIRRELLKAVKAACRPQSGVS